MHQQEKANQDKLIQKNAVNGFAVACQIYQRALLVPFRIAYGRESLGKLGAFAFLLMLVVAGCTGSPFMWAWIACWMICLMQRRIETKKLLEGGTRLHSMYDGYPKVAMLFTKNENLARSLIEPLMVLVCGVGAYQVERDLGLQPVFSAFLLGGVMCLPLVEKIRQRVVDVRAQSLMDSRLEQEAIIEEYRRKWGE